MKKLVIILPAFNEAKVIYNVLVQLKKITAKLPLQTEICVVNDGSSDDTLNQAAKAKVIVLTHLINRGLGASLGTGLAYARQNKADYAVTMDSDGQHDPLDIKTILKPILNQQVDVVIGSRRMQKKSTMPWLRRLLNHFSNLLTYLLFGVWTTDSLSGFRAFNQKAIGKINLRTDRMEVSNEFFQQIKTHHLRLTEVPIKIIYTDYSISKGQKSANAFAIIFKLLLRLFR